MSTLAKVTLWGTRIGVVALDDGAQHATFQYEPTFLRSGIEVSPLQMPLRARSYAFPTLSPSAFHGLPGLLSDSLPDKYGNALIDAWLATQGRTPGSFNAVERLCYIGTRGMGALEFSPVMGPRPSKSKRLEIDALVELVSEVLTHRNDLSASFSGAKKAGTLKQILQVGTSAGGARAKAVVAWNPRTNEVRSGQASADPGFEHWLLKFDGVKGNKDRDLADPQGYGAVEYAYAQMAEAAGISVSPCRLLEENGRRHFMTRRFDRLADGDKLHMQSLAALAHLDFNDASSHSYEQALLVIRQLGLPMVATEQQFRRMTFNIVARNQDDHVKNIAFLMDRTGTWRLSPAFDMTWSYNPKGKWTVRHQMSMNGKRDNFTIADFRACARSASMKRGRAEVILAEVVEAVGRWRHFASAAKVDREWRGQIAASLRLKFPAS